ncbi:uncharacterized protein A1O9_03447 [Exophiala aquamarina CBS 119918]|uniref:SET domain-containing protein n=1 Tax=Exophiala aquamarina CBS 119918 TaxID=1182545 RepID=A0A072Q1W7_9EURO|nr:uncharacterized protein A1O9_03447 [Exophiala aquamarina CBS 119918]KEF61875.1 hypothetical protein A1O9_03447 [Exophiala aquamarina CBS 119918]
MVCYRERSLRNPEYPYKLLGKYKPRQAVFSLYENLLFQCVSLTSYPNSYWPSPTGRTTTQAIALGLGSMFNHSTLQQNIGWKRNTQTGVIVYSALRDIKSGEELCISYGNARLWFPDADADANAKAARCNGAMEDGAGEPPTEMELSGLGKMEL